MVLRAFTGIALIAVISLGCEKEEDRACTPGQSVACVGVGGCSGAQVCNAEGSGFGTCECGSTGGGNDAGVDAGHDAGSDVDGGTDGGTGPCDLFTQTGCPAQQRCAFVRTSAGVGSPACVTQGTVADGAVCTLPTTGADDCIGSAHCTGSICEAICDPAGDGCGANSACMALGGFQSPEGTTLVGICSSKCDPVTQVRLEDGAAACGSPDPANPTQGCYGVPGEDFFCAPSVSARTHGEVVPPPVYLNSCAPGYAPLLNQSTGSTDAICVAFCAPGETHKDATANADGVSPHTCASRGASGAECRYFHLIETPFTANTNTVGICFDYGNFTYDHDMNNGTPDVPTPSCTTVDAGTGPGEHLSWGCGPLPVP